MNQAISDQVIAVINDISTRLVASGTDLFVLMYKQAIVEGTLSVMWAVISIIIIVMAVPKFISAYEKPEIVETCYSANVWSLKQYVKFYGSLICIIVFLITFGSNITTAIEAFYNPGWYTIQSIIDSISSIGG